VEPPVRPPRTRTLSCHSVTRISGSSKISTSNRPVICSGEYFFSRSCSTAARGARLVTSFAGFGLLARS